MRMCDAPPLCAATATTASGGSRLPPSCPTPPPQALPPSCPTPPPKPPPRAPSGRQSAPQLHYLVVAPCALGAAAGAVLARFAAPTALTAAPGCGPRLPIVTTAVMR